MVWLFLLIILAPAAIVTAAYNRLLITRIALKNAFAQIDVLLTRRYGLLPNLIDSVCEHLAAERAQLEGLVARCEAAHELLKSTVFGPGNAVAVRQLAGADHELNAALAQLLALAQRHPELEGSLALTVLTEELTVTERKLAAARQAYNSAVVTYNIGRGTFPGSVCAGYFGFTPSYPLPLEVPSVEGARAAARGVAPETHTA